MESRGQPRVEALGPVGERVAARLKRIRQERGLTLSDLASKLDDLGRPILVSALSKIEKGQRRVDADDLIALALALDVSPNQMLLPPDASMTTTIELTKSMTMDASAAWRWATQDVPLPTSVSGPVAQSAYLEQVRRIAPSHLHDRDEELAELTRFCTEPGQATYAWWRAPAWAGKSALMSWFVLHPPPDVQIVSFFVTARYKGQDDRGAFTDAVMEQLAEPARTADPGLSDRDDPRASPAAHARRGSRGVPAPGPAAGAGGGRPG